MDPIIKPALKFLLVMTLLTGIIYPLFITGVAQLVFRDKGKWQPGNERQQNCWIGVSWSEVRQHYLFLDEAFCY